MGWGTLNLLASAGAALMACGVVMFLVDVVRALVAGEVAGRQSVGRRHARMGDELAAAEQQLPAAPDRRRARAALGEPARSAGRRRAAHRCARCARDARARRGAGSSPAVSRARRSGRCSTAIATTVLFIWSIFTPWGVVYGALPVFVTMVGWFWPKSPDEGGTPALAARPSHAAAAG